MSGNLKIIVAALGLTLFAAPGLRRRHRRRLVPQPTAAASPSADRRSSRPAASAWKATTAGTAFSYAVPAPEPGAGQDDLHDAARREHRASAAGRSLRRQSGNLGSLFAVGQFADAVAAVVDAAGYSTAAVTRMRPRSGHAQRLGGGERQIDHAAFGERPAVVDDDHARCDGSWRSVTRSRVPNGSVRCAAVNFFAS